MAKPTDDYPPVPLSRSTLDGLVERMEVAVRDHDWLRVRAVLAEMKAVVGGPTGQIVGNADEKRLSKKASA
jgi:hypothetical protein